jgi:hypothetical protein
VDLNPVAFVMEVVLISRHSEHSLQSLIAELHHPTTPPADQMGMFRLLPGGFVAFKSLTEIVLQHQAALD